MFCSSCSRSVNPGLSYCNHCGARAPGKGDERPAGLSSFSFNFLILGLLLVPLAGGGLIIALLTVMKKELGFGEDMIGLIVFMSFVLLLIAELGLIWLLWLNSRIPRRVTDVRQTAITGTPDVIIKGLPESRLDPIFQPVPSVIEHTTNMLDAVPRKTTERDLS